MTDPAGDAAARGEAAVADTAVDPAAVTAWARLVRAHRELMGQVEGDLKAAGLPPLAWYDVLLELDRKGDDGAAPRDLEKECLLEQYNLSRLLDRMEQRGLVARRPFPGDRRRQLVAITGDGRALRRRMWPVYRSAIGRLVGARLTGDDAARLASLLGALTGQGSESGET